MARIGDLAAARPRRDVDALERGARLRERGPEAVEGLDARAAPDRVLVGVEAPGIFESRDGGDTFSLVSTLAGEPGSESWDDPSQQPPGHLGISGLIADPDDAERFWAIVQGVGTFETPDGGSSWTPRNSGLRADWPREHEEVGFCVHKLVRSRADGDRMYQQNHVGMHRSDDCGASWTEITEGLPSDFGFAAAAHPHDRDTFFVIPLDPLHDATMPEGKAAVWRTRDAGSSWERLTAGLPQRDAHLGVLRQGMTATPRTSRALLRHEHGSGVRKRRRRRIVDRDRELPPGDLLRRRRGRRVSASWPTSICRRP